MLSKLVTFIGLDAIGRVLKRAKQVGMSDFGQGYVSELFFFFQNGVLTDIMIVISVTRYPAKARQRIDC